MARESRTPFIPIYRELFQRYKEDILSQKYPPDYRIDSINELQAKHGVSRETAKTVLKMLADEGLIVQKSGKGSFVVNLGPCLKKWGIIVPFFSTFIEELIAHLRRLALGLQRNVEYFIDYNNWEEEINLVGKMINERYEAVIVIPSFDETKTNEFYTKLKTGGTLVTFLDHTMSGSFFTYVIQSYDLGVKRAVHYLKEKTDGNICFVKNNIWLGRNMAQEVMEESFCSFVRVTSDTWKPFVIDDIHSLSREWVREQNIKGFLCGDTADAVRILGRCREWDLKVPADVSVVSYGNPEMARFFTPAITSIDPHCLEMAEKTVYIIREYLSGNDVKYFQYVLSPELVQRET